MTAKNKDGKPINFCEMPSDVRSAKEALIYRAVLRCHCSHPDKPNANHKCCGQITINEKTITMNCVKCGDSRATIPPQYRGSK